MFTRKSMASLLAATSLLVGASGAMASPDQHEKHEHMSARLSLDKGKKWSTDETLRHEMTTVRSEMDRAARSIRERTLVAADYTALAGRVQDAMARIVADCKLAPEADAQLHVVLARLGEGVDAMKAGEHRARGAHKVVEALNAYGRHFDHPGWKPIRI